MPAAEPEPPSRQELDIDDALQDLEPEPPSPQELDSDAALSEIMEGYDVGSELLSELDLEDIRAELASMDKQDDGSGSEHEECLAPWCWCRMCGWDLHPGARCSPSPVEIDGARHVIPLKDMDVSMPIASIRRTIKCGNWLVIEKDGGMIASKTIGHQIKLHERHELTSSSVKSYLLPSEPMRLIGPRGS